MTTALGSQIKIQPISWKEINAKKTLPVIGLATQTKIPTDFMQQAVINIMKEGGLGGLNFAIEAEGQSGNIALKGMMLPQYLSSLGLSPQQITAVMYGLYRETKLLGQLSPQDDNAVHITRDKILKMSKDPILEAKIQDLFLKVSRAKSWEPLYKKEDRNGALVAPDLWHNPQGCTPTFSTNAPVGPAVEVVNVWGFIKACGIDAKIVDGAMKEARLLKGEIA